MHKKIFTLLLACLNLQAAEPSVIVGTNTEFPPFSYLEKGQATGFDIDIAKEVAKRLGKSIQWKDMPFDALIPEAVLGHIDFGAAGFTYTEERAKRVFFTKNYLEGDPLVILSKTKEPLSQNLTGKTVGVVEGFTSDLFLSKKPGINLVRLPTQTDGFTALKAGRIEAFVTAKSTVNAFLASQKDASFQMTALDGSEETCAIIVPKSKPEMLKQVQKALDEMQQEGVIDALKTKWNL
jgi:polar amino acid transport system substrate-binding protein